MHKPGCLCCSQLCFLRMAKSSHMLIPLPAGSVCLGGILMAGQVRSHLGVCTWSQGYWTSAIGAFTGKLNSSSILRILHL